MKNGFYYALFCTVSELTFNYFAGAKKTIEEMKSQLQHGKTDGEKWIDDSREWNNARFFGLKLNDRNIKVVTGQ
jgi:hypothetical protein